MGNSWVSSSELDEFGNSSDIGGENTEEQHGELNEYSDETSSDNASNISDDSANSEADATKKTETEMLITYLTLNDSKAIEIWNRKKVDFDKYEIAEVLANAARDGFVDMFRVMMYYTDILATRSMITHNTLLPHIPLSKLETYFYELQDTIDAKITGPRITEAEAEDLNILYDVAICKKDVEFLSQIIQYMKQYGVEYERIKYVPHIAIKECNFSPAIMQVLITKCKSIGIDYMSKEQLAAYKEYVDQKYKSEFSA